MGNRRLRTGECQGIVWVQCGRGGIFVAYCALILWQVCELATPIELGIALLAVWAETKYRACRGGDKRKNCGQWVQYSVRCRPSDTAEFAMGKEGKEEHEEFLQAGNELSQHGDLMFCIKHTVNACHTIWRFMNS